MDLANRRVESLQVTLSACEHSHPCIRVTCLSICVLVRVKPVCTTQALVSWCWFSTIPGMSAHQGLSVWVQMSASGYISVHLHLSPCIRVASCLLPDTTWTQLPAVLPELCPIPPS